MKHESLLRTYVGNKFIGSQPPVLVIVGDNTLKHSPFGEHFIFLSLQKHTLICRRDVITLQNARAEYFDFEAFPEIFSASSILINQFQAAQAHLENFLCELDRKRYMEIFWEGRFFEFIESDDKPLIHFKVFGRFQKELAYMFESSRSKKLRELKEKFAQLPSLKIQEELNDAKA